MSHPTAIYKLREWIRLDKFNNSAWVYWSHYARSIHLLEANQDKINWQELSYNPAAIHLLKANQNKINWQGLTYNPAIFTYDYEAMKRHTNQLHDELIREVYHPQRVIKWVNKYGMDREYLE